MDEAHRIFVESLVGTRIGGRYVVERVLAAGGMGLVAAGRYPELDQEVAIKFMRPEYASTDVLVARFLREARLAARVKSPHFVRIFDFGKLDNGVPYLVMEFLAGSDLHRELESGGEFPVEQAIDYVLQAALGLAEVHALGIVHRDLKPSNLFLAEAGGTRTIKVLDFGVSKEHGEGHALTSTGQLVGTPHYMSPEQIRESKSADVRSDVWSLGVILYELLTSDVPFGGDGEAIGEVYGLILHTDPVPLRTRKSSLPAGLEQVVSACLRRNPSERYANVGALADALVPFAGAHSLPLVDAIHRALASAPARVALASDTDPSDPRIALAISPTVESSPQGKEAGRQPSPAVTRNLRPADLRTPRSPVAPEPEPRPRPAPETAMTASKGVPDGARAQEPKRSALWISVAGVGVAAIAVAAFVLGGRSGTAGPPGAGTAPALSAPIAAAIASPVAPASTVVAVSASAAVAPAPPPTAEAMAPSIPSSDRRSSPSRANGTNAPTRRGPPAHTSPLASASPAGAAPPSPSAAPGDLLLDRK